MAQTDEMMPDLQLDVARLDAIFKKLTLILPADVVAVQQFTQAITLVNAAMAKILPTLQALQAAMKISTSQQAMPVANDGGGTEKSRFITAPSTKAGMVADALNNQVQLQKIESEMDNSWFSPAQIQQAEKIASAQQVQIKGTTLLSNLQTMEDLSRILYDPALAMKMLPVALKAAVRDTNIGDDSPTGIDNAATNMANAATKPTAVLNPATKKLNENLFQQIMNGIANVTLMTTGTVKAKKFLGIMAALPASVLSQIKTQQDFAALVPMILAMKHSSLAPALTALGQVFAPGTMAPQTTAALQKIGLKPGAALYASSPDVWFQTKLIPALVAHGYKTAAAQQAFLGTALGGTKFFPALQSLLASLPQIETNMHNYQKTAANKRDTFDYIDSTSVVLNVNSATVAYQSLFLTVGKLTSPTMIAGIGKLVKAVNLTNAEAQAHPDVARAGVAAAGAGAAALGVAYKVKSVKKAVSVITKTGRFIGRILGGSGEAEGIEAVGETALVESGPYGWLALGLLAGGYEVYEHRKAIGNFLFGGGQAAPPAPPTPAPTFTPQAGETGYPPVFMADKDHPLPVYLVGANYVTVENPGDIHNGTIKALTTHLGGVQGGLSDFNYDHNFIAPSGAG